MRNIKSEEVKQIQLELLDSFIEFCEENNLRYFLVAGTLLGAIRHHGYIPWDDDIDVAMPRQDYEKLLQLYSGENSELLTVYNTDGYYYPFAKLVNPRTVIYEKTDLVKPIGIYVDIFPVDILPKRKWLLELEYLYRMILEFIFTCKTAQVNKRRTKFRTFVIRFFRRIFKNMSLQSLGKHIDIHAKRYMKETESPYMGFYAWGYGRKEVMKKEVYDVKNKVLFEGRKCYIPEGYDQFLSSIYGDYMKLPPIEKRVAAHGFTAYWVDDKSE